MTTERYFSQNPLLIPQPKPNAGVPSELYTNVVLELKRCITRYEKEYLEMLFGDELYNEYIEDMKDDELKQKWDLLNAKLWDADNLISPVANYIYYKFLGDNAVGFNGRTFSTQAIENETVIPTIKFQVKAWNEMCKMNKKIFTWLYEQDIDTTAELDCSYWDYLSTYQNSYL